jgi:hypothetical protein
MEKIENRKWKLGGWWLVDGSPAEKHKVDMAKT